MRPPKIAKQLAKEAERAPGRGRPPAKEAERPPGGGPKPRRKEADPHKTEGGMCRRQRSGWTKIDMVNLRTEGSGWQRVLNSMRWKTNDGPEAIPPKRLALCGKRRSKIPRKRTRTRRRRGVLVRTPGEPLRRGKTWCEDPGT